MVLCASLLNQFDKKKMSHAPHFQRSFYFLLISDCRLFHDQMRKLYWVGGGVVCCQTFSFVLFSLFERDWPPCQVLVVFFGLATNTLNVRNNNNNNNNNNNSCCIRWPYIHTGTGSTSYGQLAIHVTHGSFIRSSAQWRKKHTCHLWEGLRGREMEPRQNEGKKISCLELNKRAPPPPPPSKKLSILLYTVLYYRTRGQWGFPF